MNKYIYVLASDGTPLMPTKRKRHIEKLVRLGKARILETVPMVVQLLEEQSKIVQPCIVAPDGGRTNVGLAVVNTKGKPLMLLQCLTRNKDIKKLMDKRKACRMASRRGERKARQRLAKRYNTMFAAGAKMRKLPKCDELIKCNYIINTEARFCNRKRPSGWLTPTATQLLRTHINLIKKVCEWVPITKVSIEVNQFAFASLEDPSIMGSDYQNGPLKGYLDVDDFIYREQNGICLLCGQHEIEHYHHIVPKHKGGSENYQNKAGLCSKCHELVHKEQKAHDELVSIKEGILAKYRGISVLNQMMPFFVKEMMDSFGSENVHLTNGHEISKMRNTLGIVKDKTNPCHVIDAYLIALSAIDAEPYNISNEYVYEVKQYRRHDRANIKAQTERVYRLDGKVVAKNRRKRTEQTSDSLHEFYENQKTLYGEIEARRALSRLTVSKSTRRYNNPNRLMPGAEFVYNNVRYVLRAQQNNGVYYLAEDSDERMRADRCQIIKKNRGLVFVQ